MPPAKLLAIILVLSGAAHVAADVTYPTGRMPFALDYNRHYQAAILANNVAAIPAVGPYFYDQFDIVTEYGPSPAFTLMDNLDHSRMRLFTIASERFLAEKYTRGQDLFLFSGGLRYQPSEYFGAAVLFNLDRAKAIDPDYTGKVWRGLAGDIETAGLYFKKGGLSLTLGRQRVFWGPQPVNLLISETAEPLDLFAAGYGKGRLQFNFLFARLDQSRPDSTDILRLADETFNDNRYLVGHRLDIYFHHRFRLGLFETTLYGGEGRPPELYYLNPLQFFHTAQLNEDEDDNTMLGFDFSYIPVDQLLLYGQLLVDDFQIDDRSRGDQEPNEFGYMAGLFKSGKTSSFSPDIRLEYVRITNRTYHQSLPRNRYLNRNLLIGHPLGPDADSLSLVTRFWPTRWQAVEFEVAYCRHGQGSVYTAWDEPWALNEGDYSEPFPTGVIEKGLHAAVHFNGYLPLSDYFKKHLFLSVNAGYGWIDNKYNVVDNNINRAWVSLMISWLGAVEFGIE
jgi:hypothetical protein